MGDLSSLIRLHKHELDEKRRVLGEMYNAMAALEAQLRELARALEAEKQAMLAAGDVHFTFANYAASVAKRRQQLEEQEAALAKKIEIAKDSLMETFSELKKYEMTQAERERIEAEERAFKEAQMMDAIGIQGFMRKGEEDES